MHLAEKATGEQLQLFFLTENTALASHRIRPLEVLPHTIANIITPDSFVGFSLLHFLFFLGKAIFAYALIRRLAPANLGLAFLTSMLFILYPADTGLFTFRALHIHCAIFLMILALYLLVVYWTHPRWYTLIGMWIALAVSLLMYEIAYPIVLFAPVLLVYLARRINRRTVWVSALWYLVPVITAIRTIAILKQPGQTYQSGVITTISGLSIISPLINAYRRVFETGWADAVSHFDITYFPQTVVISIIALLGFWMLYRMDHLVVAKNEVSAWRYAALFAIGLGVISLGYALYLLSPAHTVITMRTFLIPSFGGALCVACSVALLTRPLPAKRVIFSSILVPLIGISAASALKEHEHYFNLSLTEQRLLGQMAVQVPQLSTENTVVIIDHASYFSDDYSFGSGLSLHYAIDYLYEIPSINVEVCYPFMIFNTQNVQCLFRPQGLFTSDLHSEQFITTYDKIVVFDYTLDHNLKLLTKLPTEYLDATVGAFTPTYTFSTAAQNALPPRRTHTLFNCWPIEPCTTLNPPTIQSTFTVDFGDSIPGIGWRSAEKTLSGTNFRWSISPISELHTWLSPTHDYTFELHIVMALSSSELDSLGLKVNGESIPLTQSKDETGMSIFRGVLPHDVIAKDSSSTTLTFSSQTELVPGTDIKLGLAYNSVKIEPIIRGY